MASKRWLDFDFSAGLGWGQIGSGETIKNPLPGFATSRDREVGRGGTMAFGSFFRGETFGAFGGFEYRTPVEDLSLKLKYDSHYFVPEDLNYPSTSPVKYGLVFRPYSGVELSFGRERGNTTMLRLSLRTSIQNGGLPKREPLPPALVPRPSLAELGATAAAAPPPAGAPPPRNPARSEPLFDRLSAHGFVIEDIRLQGADALVAVSRGGPASALRDAAIAAMDALLPDVTTLVLVDRTGGIERERQQVRRNEPFADDLYGRMGALGVDVLALDVVGNDVRMRVVAREHFATVDLAAVAREANAALSMGGSVTVTDANSQRAETWLAFGPPAPFVLPANRPPAIATGAAVVQVQFTNSEEDALRRRMQQALREQGITLERLDVQATEAFVAVSAFQFRQTARNVGLAARVVAKNLPTSVEKITIGFVNGGLEVVRTSFMRSDLERAVANNTPETLLLRMDLQPGQPGFPGWDAPPSRYPTFSWFAMPQLRQHIGGPKQFYLYQFWLALSGNVEVAPGLSFTDMVGKNLYHNFDRIKLESDSQVPHVRSDIKNYLQEGADNLVQLQVTQLFKPAQNIYARLTSSILEEMYGGERPDPAGSDPRLAPAAALRAPLWPAP